MKNPPRSDRAPIDRILAGDISKAEMDQYVKSFYEREAKRKAEQERLREECLKRLGYEGMDLEKMKEDGYRRNLRNNTYVCNHSAMPGSIDNPREVGMSGCCRYLAFLPELGGWVLTDGLGNGVSR